MNSFLYQNTVDATLSLKGLEHAYREWLLALDAVSDLIFLHDCDFRILRCNKAYQQYTGLPFEQIIGQPYYEVFPKVKVPTHSCLKSLVSKHEEVERFTDELGRVFRMRSLGVYDEDEKYLNSIHIIENITESELSKTKIAQAEDFYASTLVRQREMLVQFIQAISDTVEARDLYTAGHQRRVSHIATAIARDMGLSDEKIDGLKFAAIIHDLGKIKIPAEILSKPSRLNNIEYLLIKMHSQYGYDIVKNVNFPWPIADIILQHHERMDGSGYPNGLKGEGILLEARILGVADVVDSMASHRPYRPALGVEAAMEELELNIGKLYDPIVVASCIRLFREQSYEIPN